MREILNQNVDDRFAEYERPQPSKPHLPGMLQKVPEGPTPGVPFLGTLL